MQSTPPEPENTSAYGEPYGTAPAYGAPRRRNKVATAAAIATGIAVISFLLLLLLGAVANQDLGASPNVGLSLVSLLLFAGFVLGAIVGLILSIVALANANVRRGAEGGRGLAIASLIVNGLILLACVALVVLAGAIIGQLGTGMSP